MKKVLRLLALFFVSSAFSAQASHNIGAEIACQQIAANTYQVIFKNYRDCSGIQPPNTTQVQITAPGCNTGRTITMNRVSQKISWPYGPAIPVNCSASSQHAGYEITTYTGTLTFSAAELGCSNWVLSWNECCRTDMENVMNGNNSGLYTEARLKLAPGLVNSSPAFDTLHSPIMYVTLNRDYAISMAASDPDGDSLVYTLMAPLSAANAALTYKAVPQNPNNFVINPNPVAPYTNPFSPQIAEVQGPAPSFFSPTYPMPSVKVDWNGPPTIPYPSAPQGAIWAANHFFDLNASHGMLKFHPIYFSNASPAYAANKYLVSLKVEEFRKINGVFTSLGSIRRETLIQVFDGSVNLNPVFARNFANNQPLPSGNQIYLRPGAPLSFQFSASDPDSSGTLNLATNATTILPGATFTSTVTGKTANGTVSWTPTALHVREQPYYFQILVRDGGNPLRGLRTETVAVRVRATGGVTGTKKLIANSGSFRAYPNPFSQELTFKVNSKGEARRIVIYNLLGREVDQIILKNSGPEEQQITWENAGKYAAGLYVAKLVAADKTVQTLKFTKLQ